MEPGVIEKLLWGGKVPGLRVALRRAKMPVVARLLKKAVIAQGTQGAGGDGASWFVCYSLMIKISCRVPTRRTTESYRKIRVRPRHTYTHDGEIMT